MKITQIHTNKPQSLSFEIFPPKKEEENQEQVQCGAGRTPYMSVL